MQCVIPYFPQTLQLWAFCVPPQTKLWPIFIMDQTLIWEISGLYDMIYIMFDSIISELLVHIYHTKKIGKHTVPFLFPFDESHSQAGLALEKDLNISHCLR